MRLVVCLSVLLALVLALARVPESPAVRERFARETPADMVFVPGGWFRMGSDDPDSEPDVRPSRRVWVPSFYLDRREVTNSEYRLFDRSHDFPAGQEDFPVTGLTREQASAYLRSLGKRLPTAAEWEKAARGTDGRRYPWGDEWREGFANGGARRVGDERACGLAGLERVGSRPAGASPYGCLDMAGNAWEWVADDHPGPPVRHVLRGGAAGYAPRFLRVYAFALEEAGVT